MEGAPFCRQFQPKPPAMTRELLPEPRTHTLADGRQFVQFGWVRSAAGRRIYAFGVFHWSHIAVDELPHEAPR